MHPTLRFSVLRPPSGFRDSPAVAALFGHAQQKAITFAYAEEPPREIVVVTIMPGDDLVASLRGLRSSFERSLDEQLGTDVTIEGARDEVYGDEGALHAVLLGGHLQIRAHLLRDRSAIVYVTVMARDATALADVLTSFSREAPWRS